MRKFSSLLIETNFKQINCRMLGLSRSTSNSRPDHTTELPPLTTHWNFLCLYSIWSDADDTHIDLRHNTLKLDRSMLGGRRIGCRGKEETSGENRGFSSSRLKSRNSADPRKIFITDFSKFWLTGFPVLGQSEPSWGQPDMPATPRTANYSRKYQQL